MHYWLVKSEPAAYSWQMFVTDKETDWTGVRNFQARNNLRAMKPGDRVLFYHSVTGKEIVGIAEVCAPAVPDTTAQDGDWVSVRLKPVSSFATAVSLETLKRTSALSQLALLKQSRLSVSPLTAHEYATIVKLGS